MKASDSKNSLAELNPPEPICFICMEEGSSDTPLIQSSLLRSCGCKFHTHTECWNKWIKGKTDADCPYCGRRTLHLSLPMTAPFQQDYTTYHLEQQNRNNSKLCRFTYKKMISILVLLLITGALITAMVLDR